jgi:hypothetical protein
MGISCVCVLVAKAAVAIDMAERKMDTCMLSVLGRRLEDVEFHALASYFFLIKTD